MPRKARSLLCYWAVRELGLSATELARQMAISQPAISQSVKRGEAIAKENGFELMDS
jgi:DNA-binding transcriptional LysR family regulator